MLPKAITKRKRATLALTAVATVVGVASAQAAGVQVVPVDPFGTNQVGTQADGRVLLPSNQYVTPAGQRITLTAEVTGSTVSPDGKDVAVQLGGSSSGAENVDIIDASTGAIVQQFGGAGTSAPYYSPDGTALFVTQARSILKYAVGSDGLVTDPTSPVTITMPNDGVFESANGAGQIDGGSEPAGSSLPLGITSSPDGSKLYVAENGSNAVDVIDTVAPSTGATGLGTTPPSADGTRAASDTIDPLVSYNFDDDSGTTVADSSGNGNNGSWVGGPTGSATPTYQAGVAGQAARVGGNNIVQLPLIAGKTDASGSFSFEVWYHGFSQTGEASVFANQNASSCSNPGFSVWMTSASDSALSECWPEAPGGPSVEYHDLGPATDNAWHYITVTVDRSAQTVKFYLDGQLLQTSAAGQMTASTVLTNVAWQLGWAPGDTADGQLDGLVDDFNYYDQAIPATQVAADYDATCAPVGCVAPPPQFTHTQIQVGNVPADVVTADGKAFVSNRGGAIAQPGQATNDSGGSAIIINKQTNAAASGTVSVIDTSTDKLVKTINVGLQPAAMTVHDGVVFVANTASDTVSVIDPRQDRVVQTVNVEPLPGSTVGAAPNAITFAGNTMLVSVGRDNAIAEFAYRSPTYPIAYQGLIPTDGYPNSVAYDQAVKKVFVGNHEGISTDGAVQTYMDKGTVTDFSLPNYTTLGTMTKQVFNDNGWEHLTPPSSKRDDNVAPVAIPIKLGQPSKIKHVILIDRENRTYDQILGDIGKGNSDPADTDFGESVTPNAHAISNQFTLFDNFYDNGMLSADGHNWLLQADNNDYLEQDSSTAWERSYPDLGGDELQNQTGGSIWNAAERAGLSVENFGEQQDYTTGQVGSFQQYYHDSQVMEGKASGSLEAPPLFDTEGDNASLNAITDHSYPGWNLNVPDQYRVDVWEKVFQQQVANNTFPNLTIMYLPNDHTGDNGSGQTPAAQIADNDLATGRVFDDISHSKYWKSSAIFVVEDDSQAGDDHVDGHRAPVLIASPYAKHGAIDDSYYSQINVTKTIEQILGIQPMNQLDRAAVPMFNAFTNKPDLTPYNAVTPETPIDQGVGATSLPTSTAAFGTPTIDGVQDSVWDNSPDNQIIAQDSINDLSGSESPLSADFRLMWDQKNLYVLADVNDSTPSLSNFSAGQLGDAVDFWINWTNDPNATYQNTSGAVATAYTISRDGEVGESDPGGHGNAALVKAAAVSDATHYVVEAAIPWPSGVTPGSTIGFNMTADDDANGDHVRDSYITWEANNIQYWLDPSMLGQVTLAPAAATANATAATANAREATADARTATANATAAVPGTEHLAGGPPAPPVPAAKRHVAKEWAAWSNSQKPELKLPDMVNPAQMNRYDWYTATNWSRPYPGDKSILAPDQVPGRNLPSDFLGDG